MLPDGSQGMAPGIRTELLVVRAPYKSEEPGRSKQRPYDEQADGGRGRKTSGRPDLFVGTA